MQKREKTLQIRQYLMEHVGQHPNEIARVAAEHFSLSRQAIQRHLNALVTEGVLTCSGQTRSRTYSVCPLARIQLSFTVAGLQEDIPWSESFRPLLKDVSKNVREILEYGFLEILNNAIEHSGSESVHIEFIQTAANITITIDDEGVGIFRKIMTEFQLPDELSAIYELVKGKLTTDPDRHSGEGIFFTSRLCDYFSLLSGSLFFVHSQPDNDWLIEDRESRTGGTHVKMTVSTSTKRTRAEVFNEFANPEKYDYSFSKTRIPISLLQHGQENLVSRSQARRLLQRFDRFQDVILDFKGVESIGQGFADEIFRVFRNGHPGTTITPINMAPDVLSMVQHVLQAVPPSSPPPRPQ